MLVLRASKAITVAAMGLLVSHVAFGNITDYETNFAFVQHVLLMDTTFPSSTIHYRAITNPALHHAAYAGIITLLDDVAGLSRRAQAGRRMRAVLSSFDLT